MAEDCDDKVSPLLCPLNCGAVYALDDLSYFTNALSSFCREIPVNWATTIERNPVALLPSACIPFIPQTDLNEQLKMYGEAPETVSVSMVTSSLPVIVGLSSKSDGITSKKYVNTFVLVELILATFVDIL